VSADPGTVEGVNALVASIDQAFGGSFGGRPDILVSNAGERLFSLNVRSVIALSKDTARR